MIGIDLVEHKDIINKLHNIYDIKVKYGVDMPQIERKGNRTEINDLIQFDKGINVFWVEIIAKPNAIGQNTINISVLEKENILQNKSISVEIIDYDLDFKVDPSYQIKVLDEFEYKKHKKNSHSYDKY